MLLGLYIVGMALSLLVFAVFMYEFLRIHKKRMVIVEHMPSKHIGTLRRGRKRMAILYSVSLIAFAVYSTIILFA